MNEKNLCSEMDYMKLLEIMSGPSQKFSQVSSTLVYYLAYS
jgi:hypothetical protein